MYISAEVDVEEQLHERHVGVVAQPVAQRHDQDVVEHDHVETAQRSHGFLQEQRGVSSAQLTTEH